MKCPLILIKTGLNVGPIAASTFQSSLFTLHDGLETGSHSQHCAYSGTYQET